MVVRIGPDSGDLACDPAPWVRVDSAEFDGVHPALFVDESQLRNAEEFGLMTAAQNPTMDWEVLGTLTVDASSRFEIDLYDTRNLPVGKAWNEDLVEKIAGAVFPDPHPDKWWNEVHEVGKIFLFVGPLKKCIEPNNRVSLEFKKHAHFGIFLLVLKAYPTGIGTRPQGY
ncbi:hypothetical protein [Mycobacteroides chelonae]|uniref:hypothetical protein n=1 Tax=Mycobacteroides chelonae TaxID=1774 RepID=UPI003AADB82E